jgi:hypothetical protein
MASNDMPIKVSKKTYWHLVELKAHYQVRTFEQVINALIDYAHPKPKKKFKSL